jgi:hypothetical protein
MAVKLVIVWMGNGVEALLKDLLAEGGNSMHGRTCLIAP